ncbi:MAG: M23 family metallopeptidase [Bacteroidota bacterium]|nr:M23 family metallopeptidase [Bacteroidota bacterium]
MITTILTMMSALVFNNLHASDFLVDTVKNLIDTTGVNANQMYQSGELFDLISILPFHDHYLSWDTTDIHPDQYSMVQMKDTVMLVLADHGDCAFVAPVAGFVTSPFGPRTQTRYHYGIDLKLDIGDTVMSAFDGVVRISQWSESYGHTVVVRHYNGLETLYAHLSERKVVPGQVVRAGELVGLGGNTGRSSGPHLHFEMRYLGKPINPEQLVTFTDSTQYILKQDTLTLCHADFQYIQDFKVSAQRYIQQTKYYTIRSGDTLSEIAERNRTTVTRLCQLNNMSRNTILRPGRKIRVK